MFYKQTSEANFTRDGRVLMDRKGYSNFIGQSMWRILRYTLNQSPDDIGLAMDPSEFFSAMTYIGDDGARHKLEDWEYAPLSRHLPANTSRATALREAEAEWKLHASKTASHIPHCYLHSKTVQEASKMHEVEMRAFVDGVFDWDLQTRGKSKFGV